MQPARLADQPELPRDFAYLWGWFCELRGQFTYADLLAWSQLTHRRLRAWETDVLVALDRLRNAPP